MVISDIVDQAFAMGSAAEEIITNAKRRQKEKEEAEQVAIAQALKSHLKSQVEQELSAAPNKYSYAISGLLAQNPKTNDSLYLSTLDGLPEGYLVACVVYDKM